jgi:hypothetical protein
MINNNNNKLALNTNCWKLTKLGRIDSIGGGFEEKSKRYKQIIQ